MDMRARRLTRRELIALDCLAAAGYLLMFPPVPAPPGQPWWAGAAASAAIGLPVALRRVWPVPVFAWVTCAALAAAVLGWSPAPFAAPAYALYTVALTARPRGGGFTRVIALACGLGLLALVVAGSPAGHAAELGGPVVSAVLLGASWTIGRAVRERRLYAERAAAELAARAVAEERLRIARELHDVVTHGMGLIAVKAGVANHVLRERPEEAHDALRVIETTSREALTEMRRMLGVLRAGEPGGLAPAPGLAGLPALAERAAAAGVRVELDVRAPDGLPEALSLAVYRIVQEAITNVVKHAAPGDGRATECRVTVYGDGRDLLVEIADDGRPRDGFPQANGRPQGGGHGLVGMRERVMMYGGRFAAGPRPGGGFLVSARLPYTDREEAS
ncbi:sensor histidine kinase [Bailinhaonella thermotolerans]|nr:sensor histidine kinase [Bailinhaonella thermotolerans]